jgi:tRNA A37 threonylcarbamoyladenosine synthetase subunit TsaC/SUA5/YrdC
VAVLKNGWLVLFLSDSGWTLVADGQNPSAVALLAVQSHRSVYGRLTGLLAYGKQALALSEDIIENFWDEAKKRWPGSSTLLTPSAPCVPAGLADQGKVAVRLPDDPLAWALVEKMGEPVAALETGERDLAKALTVLGPLEGRVGLILDGVGKGTSSKFKPVVVDASGTYAKILPNRRKR